MSELYDVCKTIDCDEPEKIESYVRRFYDGTIPNGHIFGNLNRWYNMDSPGVVQLLRLYLNEFASLFRADGKYKIYASTPCPQILPNVLSSTGKIKVNTAELCSMVVLQGILGQPPVKTMCCWSSRCAMLDNRKGFVQSGILPKPDMLWSFGLLCDECCKTDELLCESVGIPQINCFCAKAFDDCRFQRYEKNLRDNISVIIDLAGADMPDAAPVYRKTEKAAILSSTICCNNAGRRQPPLKAATISLIQTSQLMAFQDVGKLSEVLEFIMKDMRHMSGAANSTKLYSYYIPPCMPELCSIYENNGIVLAGSAAFITKPVQYSHSKTLCGMAAAAWDASILSRSNDEYSLETAKAIKKYNCDGYLNGMFGFDRWLGSGHRITDREIGRLSGKPVFQCSTDFWGRGFNRSKIESLAETTAYLIKANQQ